VEGRGHEVVSPITSELRAGIPQSRLARLDGRGHDAIDTAPGLIASLLGEFFG